MRLVAFLVCLAGTVVVVACLEAGMGPTASHRTASAQPRTAAAIDEPPIAGKTKDTPAPTPPRPPMPVADVVAHTSPRGVAEACHRLVKFPFEPPDVTADPDTMRWFRDDDFDDIARLCAMDFYLPESTATETAVGVCPKNHWSTPAFEIYDLDTTRADKRRFEAKQCPRYRRRSLPKVAKLKAPVYAKEAESALMYFHFSRLLGNAGFVYPATWRTVDRREWIDMSRDALEYISHFTVDATPEQGWKVLLGRHRKQKTVAVIGGSLAKNPRGEWPHDPFLWFPTHERRISSPSMFRKQSYFKLVNSKKPVREQLAFDTSDPFGYRADVQALAYAQDFTALVVMDHLFNARDRAGNIHARAYDHFVDDDGHLRWKKTALPDDDKRNAKRKGKAAAKPPKPKKDRGNTVELERLILKDNDDALLWDVFGRLNATPLVGDLRHLDSLLYLRMQWLARLMENPEDDALIRAYFVDAVHVQPKTYDDVRERFLALADRLLQRYDDGELELDLDLDAVVAAAPPLPPDAKPKKRRYRRHH
jgi:hypothetical protein